MAPLIPTAIPQRPLPAKESLLQFYLHKTLTEIPKPAAILDRAIITRHCTSMHKTIQTLGVDFRAHVKSHKTTELARLQVGTSSQTINFVASTLLEIENLAPLLKEYRDNGHRVNILYGIPVVPSQVDRLAAAAAELGEGSVSVMVDHPDQVRFLDGFAAVTGFPVGVFVKVDCGYHRAGLPPAQVDKGGLLGKLAEAESRGLG
ncbi:hypothetical protein ETB97_003856, partial [Aspergillus alliaceus]